MTDAPPHANASAPEPGTLAALLAEAADHTSTRRLALLAGNALALAIAVAAAFSTWWPFAALLLGVASFAGWALANRAAAEVARRPQRDPVVEGALRVAAVVSALVGGLAVLGAIIALATFVIGTAPIS